MARIRAKDSTYPLGGLGLLPQEDKLLKKLINGKISIKALVRQLVRNWIKENKQI